MATNRIAFTLKKDQRSIEKTLVTQNALPTLTSDKQLSTKRSKFSSGFLDKVTRELRTNQMKRVLYVVSDILS